MTSKEALEHIVNNDYNTIITTDPPQQAYNGLTKKEMAEIIEKDLDVLDILKSYFNIWKNREGDFVIEFSNEPVIVITKEEIENKYDYCGKELKIKEWLEENDK